MRKQIALLMLTSLAGCVESTPNPAWEKMTAACDAGDTQACAVILDQQQRQREAWSQTWAPPGQSVAEVYTSVAPRPGPAPQVQPLAPGNKMCPNGYIVPVTYIC
jgi:hypothetical protein